MTRRTQDEIDALAAARAGLKGRLHGLARRIDGMSLPAIANLHEYLDDFREDERGRSARIKELTSRG